MKMSSKSRPKPELPPRVGTASLSSFAGGLAGSFADIVIVRMQRDAVLPVSQWRNHKHAVDGLVLMATEEGITIWLRGWGPNSGRAAVHTASQLASCDAAKRLLMDYAGMEDAVLVQLAASLLMGMTPATVTTPIDVIEMRAVSSSERQAVVNRIQQNALERRWKADAQGVSS